jgi:protease I
MKHLLMIIANQGFQDIEFSNPYHLFLEKGYTVDICSGKGGECFGVFNTHISDSLSFDEVQAEQYDALVFVGGGGAYNEYHNHPTYLALAKKAKILAAICIAPSLLAPSGIFKGKEVTGRDDGRCTEICILQES